jgi:hypothetical protein
VSGVRVFGFEFPRTYLKLLSLIELLAGDFVHGGFTLNS